jgi:hypothetical protein
MTQFDLETWITLIDLIGDNYIYFSENELEIGESESIASGFVNAYASDKPLPYKKTPPVDLAEEMNELLSGVVISRNSLQGED